VPADEPPTAGPAEIYESSYVSATQSGRRVRGADAEPPSWTAPPLGIAGLIVGSAVALLVVSVNSEHLLGQIAAPILGVATLHGLFRGALRKIIMLPITTGAVYCAVRYFDSIKAMVTRLAGAESTIGSVVAAGVLVLFALFVVGRLVRWVRRRVIMRRRLLLLSDRVLGAGIGFAEGALIVLAFAWGSTMAAEQLHGKQMPPEALPPGSAQARVADVIERLAVEANAGPIGEVVAATDPLERMPELRGWVDGMMAKRPLDLNNMDPAVLKRLEKLLPAGSGKSVADLQPLIEKLDERKGPSGSRVKIIDRRPTR